ncbi:DUF4198 domain-containing protein [Rubritalea sp.]|uniref:DUF4198 domain-containing protein n=1 Tax=Rubritalea sp. TaxID=2109375 RepID=UPI003EF792E8
MKILSTSTIAAFALVVSSTHTLQAHRAWILPSTTVLSGESPWVTFDAAASNNLFFPNHRALSPEALIAIGPDGKPVTLQNAKQAELRTTFDLELTQPGTYKIFTSRLSFGASWKEGEERKRWRGTKEEFAKQELTKKTDISTTSSFSRIETFVTSGAPTTNILKPTGKGLELLFDKTHPNDLFSGEAATFTLHQDGKPAANTEVSITKGNDRFRNEEGTITVTTDDKGTFTVTWPSAGRYWLNSESSQDLGAPDGVPLSKRASYTAVFEVLPE